MGVDGLECIGVGDGDVIRGEADESSWRTRVSGSKGKRGVDKYRISCVVRGQLQTYDHPWQPMLTKRL